MPLFSRSKAEGDEPAPSAETVPPPAAAIPSAVPTVASPNGPRPTCFGPELRVKGEVVSREDVLVQGFVSGRIESDAQVVIQPSGRIQADVSARRIEVHGSVVGDLVATEAVVLGAEARLTGNIAAPSVAVSRGAIFHGFTRTEQTPATAAEAPEDDS